VRYIANTIEDMKKLLLGYRDNMRVEVETDVAVTASTVADLRALATWPDGLVLNIHVDLDPRFSVVRVGAGLLMPERRSPPPCFISGLKRISNRRPMMSAFGGKADIGPDLAKCLFFDQCGAATPYD
jgi:hypothetical protein